MAADEDGSIAVAKQADIILLDRYHLGLIPLHDPVQQIAFGANRHAVRTSAAGGRMVIRASGRSR
jgi:cytosine/adenosine deaminase-related metal-dependent hydrolase